MNVATGEDIAASDGPSVPRRGLPINGSSAAPWGGTQVARVGSAWTASPGAAARAELRLALNEGLRHCRRCARFACWPSDASCVPCRLSARHGCQGKRGTFVKLCRSVGWRQRFFDSNVFCRVFVCQKNDD
ncbi:hypothetical protein LBW62_25495, partial [Ralstonia solanacearum]